MKTVVFCILAALTLSAFAETSTNAAPRRIKIKRSEIVRRQGGFVVKPGSFQGKIAIINRQTKLAAEDIAEVTKELAKETGCNFVVADDDKGAVIALTVVDDASAPKLLVAPDDRWGKVNVAKLTDDLPAEDAKAKFFKPRARKMIIRAVSLLCGGGSSQYRGNIMSSATLRELDLAPEKIPADMLERYAKYLEKIGVTRMEKVPYLTACREGWAPAPTNEIQKAIWDKVKEVPANPIKIEFDPKKGR